MLLPRFVPVDQPGLDQFLTVRGISSEELAERAEVPVAHVRRWRSGKSCPQRKFFQRLHKALNIRDRELLRMLSATYDAKKDDGEQRAVRLASAAMKYLATLPRISVKSKRCLRRLAKNAKALGKLHLKLVVSSQS
jgi:transcriptional regulator with XRE-family HTH domain